MLTIEEVKNIKIEEYKNIHLIGMISGFNSFCATVLLSMGIKVTASEYVQDDPRREYWEKKGILFSGGHSADNVNEKVDLIVYPNGPIPGNPECEKAEQMGIPAITISQLTGILSRNYKTIAVAGTHGKTTTSAMIVWLLNQTIGVPNFIIGDKVLGLDKDWNISHKSEYLVIEACEYKRQFLDRAPNPFMTVITHIGLDHTDYYKDQKDYNSAFIEFLGNTTNFIVSDESAENESRVLGELDLKSRSIELIKLAELRKNFDNKVVSEFKDVNSILLGDHNRENLLRVYGVAVALNISNADFIKAMKEFPGVKSRFEKVGQTKVGSPIFYDYAHNPTKIKACLQGAREQFPEHQIILVFQPHSHERTASFKDEYVHSFDDADVVLVPNIFSPGRETKQEKEMITAEEFVEYLSQQKTDKEFEHTKDFESTVEAVKRYEKNRNSVVILASAGDLNKIIELLKT